MAASIEHQKNKNWAELRSTTDSIILLQPHHVKVWNFQGWNLAYNVSAEWDKVDDRFYWVKEGIKFLQRGVRQNNRHPELYWYVGDTLGKKIGRADEWRQYRGYFMGKPGYPDPEPDPDDPEPDIRKRRKRFPRGYDEELNRDGKDNYLVAKDWFILANEREEARPDLQHIMADVLFRTYPARAQTDYAMALQKEGSFDEVTRDAWAQALDEWINRYGQDEFDTQAGKIRLEVSNEELAQWEKEAAGAQNFDNKAWWVQHYTGMANYAYWKRRCRLESERNTDYLIPVNVESGDKFSVTLNGQSINHTAAAADPVEVVKGLAESWRNKRQPEFDEVRAEVSEQTTSDGKSRPALRLTWSTASVAHVPVIAATDGGQKDDQALEHVVHTRSIVEAHRELYEGQEAHFSNDFVKAERSLTSGLQKFAETLREYPDFLHDDDLAEEIMIGIHEWRQTLSLMEEKPDEKHPLIEVERWFTEPTTKDLIFQEKLQGESAHGGDFLAAEKDIMSRRHPLTVLLTIHGPKQSDINVEYLRRLKTFNTPYGR